MSRVVHFEVPTTDAAASAKFYETVFGWKLTQWPGGMEYYLISTGDPDARGIDGGLGGAANEFHGTVNTLDVADLDDTLAKALANGATVIMPKDLIPGVGYLAYIREPGGAAFGLMQALPGTQF